MQCALCIRQANDRKIGHSMGDLECMIQHAIENLYLTSALSFHGLRDKKDDSTRFNLHYILFKRFLALPDGLCRHRGKMQIVVN